MVSFVAIVYAVSVRVTSLVGVEWEVVIVVVDPITVAILVGIIGAISVCIRIGVVARSITIVFAPTRPA